jgi:predicted DNA-binding transcriptional regulator AlpA
LDVPLAIKAPVEEGERKTVRDDRDAAPARGRKQVAVRSRLDGAVRRPPSGGLTALLTAKDLEGWLQISVKTIYGYVQRGLIPYVKIESNVRFRGEEILEWIERQSFRPLRPR